jgi:hypothetical protein
MDSWGEPEADVDDDSIVADEVEINFTSLDLDTEGNPERVAPEDADDWGPEDYSS